MVGESKIESRSWSRRKRDIYLFQFKIPHHQVSYIFLEVTFLHLAQVRLWVVPFTVPQYFSVLLNLLILRWFLSTPCRIYSATQVEYSCASMLSDLLAINLSLSSFHFELSSRRLLRHFIVFVALTSTNLSCSPPGRVKKTTQKDVRLVGRMPESKSLG